MIPPVGVGGLTVASNGTQGKGVSTQSKSYGNATLWHARRYGPAVAGILLVAALLATSSTLSSDPGSAEKTNLGPQDFTRHLAASQLLGGFSEHGAQIKRPLLEQYRRALDPYFRQYDDQPLPKADNDGYTLVLQIRDDYLNDVETGIVARSEKKGVHWERPGFATLLNGGQEVFRSPVGVRVHGGYARVAEDKFQLSYRLYFRPAYRSVEIGAATLWPEASGELDRLVVLKTDMDLHTAISFDVARRLGLPAPYMVPMRFFINGDDQRTKLISQHLGTPFLESRFGKERYDYFRRKDDDSNPFFKEFNSLAAKWRADDKKISLEEVEADIDLDALLHVYLMQIFIELYDSYQGMVVRRREGPDRRWFFVPWDLEGSLLYNSLQQQFYETHPDQPKDYFSHIGSSRVLTQERIWRDLGRSKNFRRRFARTAVDALNHLLTDSWLNGEIDHYQSVGLGAGLAPRHLEEIEEIRGYLASRPDTILTFLSKRWELGQIQEVRVEGTPGTKLSIDGHITELPYHGRYLSGMEVAIDGSELPGGVGWTLNAQPVDVPSGRLKMKVDGPTVIRIERDADAQLRARGSK